MNPRDVPEDRAREVRCPGCTARRGYPCHTTSLARGGRNRTKQRACMLRRRAWLDRNNAANEETA